MEIIYNYKVAEMILNTLGTYACQEYILHCIERANEPEKSEENASIDEATN